MSDTEVGPVNIIANLEDESHILDVLIGKMLREVEDGERRDPQLIRYLQEYRQVQQALHAIGSGKSTKETIRITVLADNMTNAMKALTEKQRVVAYSRLEELQEEAEKLALPE